MLNIDELIAKHLVGESSPAEESDLQKWLAASGENRRYFADLQWLWQNSAAARPGPDLAVDTESALRKVKAGIARNARLAAAPMRVGFSRFWMQAAVVATLALALAAIFWLQKNLPMNRDRPGDFQAQISAADAPRVDTLTDGSEISLNRNASLRPIGQFNRSERRVALSGEAFFKVKPDAERPFVVEIQNFEVKVVGTAFNIGPGNAPGFLKVQVSEGKVQVSSQGKTEILTPGQAAECEISTGRFFREQTPDPNFLAWKNRVFFFDAVPLEKVIRQISLVYGVHISLKNKDLANCQLSARYENLPLEHVLELVAESFSLKVEKSGETFLLDGEACE